MIVFLRLMLVIFALVTGFGAIIYLIYQTYSYIKCGCGKYGPFVSSYGKIKDDILDEARAILEKSNRPMNVTDLGCGSGALLLPLAKEFPHHTFIGYEWDVVPLTMGKIKATRLHNVKFIKADYMKENYADMDLIMCYVLKVTGAPLGKKLNTEIKSTATVISEMFPLGSLKEVKQIQSSIYGVPEKIFVYKKNEEKKEKPAKIIASDKASKKQDIKKTTVKKTTTKSKETSKTKKSK